MLETPETAKRLVWCAQALVGLVGGQLPAGATPERSVARVLAEADALCAVLETILGTQTSEISPQLRQRGEATLRSFWETRGELVDARRAADDRGDE